MDFRFLGTLEVVGPDGPIALGGTLRRGLLALLLVHRGRVLPADRIVTELWDDGASRAVGTVQTYVSQLRKTFGDMPDVTLTTQPAGYVLDVPEQSVDAARFEHLARAATEVADPRQRLEQFDAALAQWGGTPLDEFSWPWATAERTRLERLHLDTVRRRLDAQLELGDHLSALAELEALTAEHPLDERLWGQRMLAAYRSGRQADALRAFQEVRRHLADALGVEPGPDLVELERRILDHDASLATVPTTGSVASMPTGVVTFLLTDIVGSSELWERHAGAMERALAHHDAIALRSVTEAGGRLLKARGEGDSTFSVFTRTSDAVTAALAVQRRVSEQAWPEPVRITIRASVHTGEAVERGGDYFGPTVNRAARIRSLASGGETLLSDAAAQVVRLGLPDGVHLADLGIREISGSRHPERVHRLTSGRAPTLRRHHPPTDRVRLPAFLAAVDAPFVGRDAPMGFLRERFTEVIDGLRQVVFVTGEPGVGKTSLVAHFCRHAAGTGAVVIAGRCDEGYEVPYQPFVEALGQLLDLRLAHTATSLDAQLGGELTRILPDAPDRIRGLPAPLDSDPETARYRLFEAVSSWLASISAVTPVVIVLDDLHWATPPTLLMLRHLVRFPTTRLMVVGTYRHTDVPLATAFADLVADITREPDVQGLPLTGLGAEDIGALLVRQRARARGAQPDAIEIHARTGGNALFVRELLRSYEDAGSTDPADLSPRVRDIVLKRVRRLADSTREVLEVAAVLGHRFSLRSMLAIGGDQAQGDSVLDALDDAVAAGIVAPVDGEPDAYEFTHAIVRDAIESSLATSRRLRLHLAAARALEATSGDANLAQLSYHYSSALPLVPVEEAVSHARRAGDRAMALLAYEEAADHFVRALDAVQRDGGPPTIQRCELLLALAEAHAGAGAVADAARASELAAEVARTLDLPEHFARAALCFEGELVSGADFWQWRLALLEEANRRLRDDSELRVRVIAMLAHVRAGLVPGPEVERLGTAAVGMAARLGGDLGLAAAKQARRQSLSMPEHTEARAALSREVLAHGDAAGVTSWAMLGRHTLLADTLELGDLATFRTDLEQYVTKAHALRRPHDLWRAEVMRAGLALFCGDLDDGEALATWAYELGTELQQPGALQSYVIQLFHVSWQRGTLADLLPSASEWADARGSTAAWRAALAVAHAQVGQADEARGDLARMAADDFAGVAQDNLWLASLTLAATAAWFARDTSVSRALRRKLAPHAARNVVVGTALALGSGERAVALMAALDGDHAAAVEGLERAIEHNRRMGSELWVRTSRQDLDDVLHMHTEV